MEHLGSQHPFSQHVLTCPSDSGPYLTAAIDIGEFSVTKRLAVFSAVLQRPTSCLARPIYVPTRAALKRNRPSQEPPLGRASTESVGCGTPAHFLANRPLELFVLLLLLGSLQVRVRPSCDVADGVANSGAVVSSVWNT